MRNLLILFFVASTFVFLFSCRSKTSKDKPEVIDQETYAMYTQQGNEISALTQGVLLANVGKAIQQGGTAYAMEFCNLKVVSITDSLDQVYDCLISRVSEKNRNPVNSLKNGTEKELWSLFRSGTLTDTLVSLNGNPVYYKTIRTGMPACLKCHGNPETDIEPATLQKLQELYPNDLATGYQLNDFRGLWKIEFTRD